MRLRIRGTRWFKMLQQKSKVVAKKMGLSYPSDDPDVMAKVHAEAERQMLPRLTKAFKKETQ